MQPMHAETVKALSDALPATLRQLVQLAQCEDRETASRAVIALRRYLQDPRSIQATVAIGTPEAATLHLNALNWCEELRNQLPARPRVAPQRAV